MVDSPVHGLKSKDTKYVSFELWKFWPFLFCLSFRTLNGYLVPTTYLPQFLRIQYSTYLPSCKINVLACSKLISEKVDLFCL